MVLQCVSNSYERQVDDAAAEQELVEVTAGEDVEERASEGAAGVLYAIQDSEGEDSLQKRLEGTDGEQGEEPEEKLPYLNLAILCLAMLSNSLAMTSVFPVLKFVVHEKYGKTEEEAGYYVGLIAGAMMTGRALTASAWGAFADRKGRKPALVISLLSMVILVPAFAFTSNVGSAIVVRFFTGFFNSLVGVGKVMATELCSTNPAHQARALSVISVSWGSGNVMGTALGGVLYNIWPAYPILPCMLIVATVSLIGFILVILYMPETLKKSNQKPKQVWHLLQDKEVMAPILMYCMWSFQGMGFLEVANLWAVTSRELGGLSLTASQMGICQSISGGASLFCGLVILPRALSFAGCVRLHQLGLFATLPLLAVVPTLFFVEDTTVVMVLLTTALSLLQGFSSCVFTAEFMMINNSTPSVNRASAQGLSMALCSGIKAVSPMFFGAIFAWSISESRPFPFNYNLSWIVLCMGTGLTALYSLRFPLSLEKPIREV